MGSTIGKRWEQDFKAAAKRSHPSAYVERFGDRLTGRGHSAASPPDLLIGLPTRTLMVECKACKGPSIPLDRVSAHQMQHMQRWMRVGPTYQAYIAVLFYNITKHPESLFRAVRDRRAYLVHADDWASYEDGYNRKSIPLSHMPEVGFELSWVRGEGWSLPSEVLGE